MGGPRKHQGLVVRQRLSYFGFELDTLVEPLADPVPPEFHDILPDALARLQAMVDAAAVVQKTRKPTRPTLASKQRRLTGKAGRSDIKLGRRRIVGPD